MSQRIDIGMSLGAGPIQEEGVGSERGIVAAQGDRKMCQGWRMD